MTPWRETHHFTPADEEGDWYYDDGSFHGLVSIAGTTLTLHDVYLRDEAKRDKRTGAGRAAMQRLRPLFKTIIVDGALHPFVPGQIGQHVSVLGFWTAMLREQLVDRVVLLQEDIVLERKPTPWRADHFEAVQMARTRLDAYADAVNAGDQQGGGREFKRKIWGAFSDYDALLQSPSPTDG